MGILMDEVMVGSLFSELMKIAQDVPVDPRAAEMEDIQQSPPEPKSINRDVLSQALKNKLLIAGGTGLGAGLGMATNIGLDRLLSGKGKAMPKWSLPAMSFLGGSMGLGSSLAYSKMREQDRKLLEEARQRGEQGE